MSDPARWYVGPLHGSIYLALSLAWMIALGTAVAITLIAFAGVEAVTPSEGTAQLGAGWMGAITGVQTVGLGAIALALLPLVPSGDGVFDRPSVATLRQRYTRGLALRIAGTPWWIAATVVGCTIGFVAGAIAEWVDANLPQGTPDSLEMLRELFATASAPELAVLCFAVCVLAPVVEELVFRGYLWHALSRSMPQWLVFVCTTLLFAAYHVYPVQALALVPTSLLLGWLRWRSGSLFPAILAHMVNNVLAALGSVALDPDVALETDLAGWQVGLAATLAVSAVAAAELWTARRHA
ncbi:MAG: membrane protease YdiL (CAAX protease family) [Myxococcota bacterium]|jgi:membrane protease YdiL (CAAX protease family)